MEMAKIISQTKKPENKHINEAIKNYNSLQKKALLEEKLKLESSLVRQKSLNVLKEFETI